MDNEETLMKVLQSYKEAIMMLESRLDAMDKDLRDCQAQCANTENVLFDQIINPARDAMAASEKSERFDDFNDKYGEKLGAYNAPLQSIEGPDFDLAQTAFDEYDGMEEKPDSDAFVDELIGKVKSQLESIKEAVGAAPEDDIEVEVDGETGETEVEVNDQPIDAEGEPASEEAPVEKEAPVEAEAEEEEIVDELPEEKPSDEEIEALKKEAEAALSKAGHLPGRN